MYTQNLTASEIQRQFTGASSATAAVVSNDPASLRGQLQALGQLAERLAGHRSCLRDIADCIVGEQPPDPSNRTQPAIAPVGGVTAEIVAMFQHIAGLLDETDTHIQRLQRVSS